RDRIAEETTARCSDDHVLPAVRALVGHRRRLCGTWKGERPHLIAGLRIERPESAIVSRTDEDEATRRCNRPAIARAPGLLQIDGQVVGHAERNLPGELARVDVNRGQPSPRRLLTR